MIRLTASDGHQLDAYCAEPDSDSGIGLVLLQEIFGVTGQLRGMADRFALQGYRVIVPALFDRVSPGTVLPFDRNLDGREIVAKIDPAATLLDVSAALDAARGPAGVAAIGYCWGGGVAYRAACDLEVSCCVSFYGTRLTTYLDSAPRVPMQFHFGGQDPVTPPDYVEAVRAANPDQPLYLYPDAGHGFANDARDGFDAEATALAERRMFDFIVSHCNA
jgi:carboxymethylenebutenolidase